MATTDRAGGRLTTLALQAAALGLLLIVLRWVKTLVDVDNHFDSWWYHLPWAARLAGFTHSIKVGPFHAADEAEVQATCVGRRIVR